MSIPPIPQNSLILSSLPPPSSKAFKVTYELGAKELMKNVTYLMWITVFEA
jgi:hypothetical protein